MAVLSINKDQFQKEVIEKKGLVMVDFYADWCGPCKLTSPIIEELSEEHKDISFVKVNVDNNQELASQYSVFSIPTFIVFKDGTLATQFVGAMGKEGFEEQLNKAKM
jgi:thioredoxin 1